MTTLYGVRQETLEAYLKAERKKVWEEAAQVAETEPELEGPMPMHVMIAVTSMPIEEQQRAAVRATKKSIAARCRAQAAKESHDPLV